MSKSNIYRVETTQGSTHCLELSAGDDLPVLMRQVIYKKEYKMRTFRVYYTDGNQRLFGANNWKELLAYLIETTEDDAIADIEEV